MIQVMSLPDWRAGNNYQELLGRAVASEGFEVVYPRGYRRGMPLARNHYGKASLLHLHWPEAYFGQRHDGLDLCRILRFSLDLRCALRGRRLVYTAHNYLPHDARYTMLVRCNYHFILRHAARVISHSEAAAARLRTFCPAAHDVVSVVPHGDLAEDFPQLPDRTASRDQLMLGATEPLVLIFGRTASYKGLERIIEAWDWLHPTARLLIAGTPQSSTFARELEARAIRQRRVTLELKWMPDVDLAVRMAAADAVLFNYQREFTSGAGCLARSLGRKIVLPAHIDTVDLMEPAPTVFRFHTVETDLPEVLARAVAAPEDPAGTAAWRADTSWQTVARQTAAIYRQALT